MLRNVGERKYSVSNLGDRKYLLVLGSLFSFWFGLPQIDFKVTLAFM